VVSVLLFLESKEFVKKEGIMAFMRGDFGKNTGDGGCWVLDAGIDFKTLAP